MTTTRDSLGRGPHDLWIAMTAALVFAVGTLVYLLTGQRVAFVTVFFSVGLVGWNFGRRWGLITGSLGPIVVCLILLGHGEDVASTLTNSVSALALALCMGGGFGHLSDVNRRLRAAYQEIRVLRGFIPICASCKNVRDDDGFWKQVEEYVSDRTDARFSHGLCPDCAQQLMEDQYATRGLESSDPPPSIHLH